MLGTLSMTDPAVASFFESGAAADREDQGTQKDPLPQLQTGGSRALLGGLLVVTRTSSSRASPKSTMAVAPPEPTPGCLSEQSAQSRGGEAIGRVEAIAVGGELCGKAESVGADQGVPPLGGDPAYKAQTVQSQRCDIRGIEK